MFSYQHNNGIKRADACEKGVTEGKTQLGGVERASCSTELEVVASRPRGGRGWLREGGRRSNRRLKICTLKRKKRLASKRRGARSDCGGESTTRCYGAVVVRTSL